MTAARHDFTHTRTTCCRHFAEALTVCDADSHPVIGRVMSGQGRSSMNDVKKKILILGGGFGGVYTAVYLDKLMTSKEREEFEIVIVSRDN